MKKTHKNARRIMYANLKKVFNNISLDEDMLNGNSYESVWTMAANGDKFVARCNDIFSNGTDIVIEK